MFEDKVISRLMGFMVATVVALSQTAMGASDFDISVVFGDGLTDSQKAVFSEAEAIWEQNITGYKPGISLTGITIDAKGELDEEGGVLAFAGPVEFVDQAGFRLTTKGLMVFDIADLPNLESNGTLVDVIVHEMAHVIGLGTRWVENGVYLDGSGEYTGEFGLAAYQTEFNQPAATFVPVELGGGSGTADGHWDEVDFGAGNTGFTNPMDRDLKFELMTGWLNVPTYLSKMTVQSFMDIGYKVVAIPLPAALPAGLLLLGCLGTGKIAIWWRRRF